MDTVQCDFCARAVDCRGKTNVVGVAALMKVLKKHEYPDFGIENNDCSDEDLNRLKHLKPKLLGTVAWHPDKALQTMSEHWDDEMRRPNHESSSPQKTFSLKALGSIIISLSFLR